MIKKPKVHILLFSERRGGARRVSLSRLMGGLVCLSLLLVASTAALSFLAFSYYHHGLPGLSGFALPSDVSLSERERILKKLDRLEAELNRGEQYATQLQTLIGVDTDEISTGRGPLLELDVAGAEKLPAQSKSRTLAAEPEIILQSPSEPAAFLSVLSDKVDILRERRRDLEDRVHQLYLLNEGKLGYSLSVPSRWPVKGWLTSSFGFRRSPITGHGQFHAGLDIASPVGTEVVAPSDGRVVFSGRKDGYGNTVILEHGFGLQTLYGHNSRLFVKAGDVVARGTKIAAVGASGRTTGPHLHYEVHVDGVPANPINFIDDFME